VIRTHRVVVREQLRKSADVFACSTVPADPNELSPTSEQECTLQDVGSKVDQDFIRERVSWSGRTRL
jgi:hypothetical protein